MDSCPECGRLEQSHHRRPLGPRLRHWFANGRPVPEISQCSEGHTWRRGSFGRLRFSTGLPRWLTIPRSVVKAMAHSRSMIPIPRTYAMAAVVGVGLGLLLDTLAGWPWWIVALVFVFAVWLFFALSFLWGHGRGSVGGSLRRAISPEREARRERAAVSTAVSQGTLSAYRAAGQTPAAVSSWSHSGTAPSSLELRHHLDNGAIIIAATMGPERESRAYRLEDAAENLLINALTPPPDLELRARMAWRSSRRDEMLGRVAEAIPIAGFLLLDGVATPFDMLVFDEGWVAAGEVGDVAVDIQATGIRVHDVALERVHDLAPHWQALDEFTKEHLRDEHGRDKG